MFCITICSVCRTFHTFSFMFDGMYTIFRGKINISGCITLYLCVLNLSIKTLRKNILKDYIFYFIDNVVGVTLMMQKA